MCVCVSVPYLRMPQGGDRFGVPGSSPPRPPKGLGVPRVQGGSKLRDLEKQITIFIYFRFLNSESFKKKSGRAGPAAAGREGGGPRPPRTPAAARGRQGHGLGWWWWGGGRRCGPPGGDGPLGKGCPEGGEGGRGGPGARGSAGGQRGPAPAGARASARSAEMGGDTGQGGEGGAGGHGDTFFGGKRGWDRGWGGTQTKREGPHVTPGRCSLLGGGGEEGGEVRGWGQGGVCDPPRPRSPPPRGPRPRRPRQWLSFLMTISTPCWRSCARRIRFLFFRSSTWNGGPGGE